MRHIINYSELPKLKRNGDGNSSQIVFKEESDGELDKAIIYFKQTCNGLSDDQIPKRILAEFVATLICQTIVNHTGSRLLVPEVSLVIHQGKLIGLASTEIKKYKEVGEYAPSFEKVMKLNGLGLMQAIRFFLEDVDGSYNFGLSSDGKEEHLACMDFGLSFFFTLKDENLLSKDELEMKNHIEKDSFVITQDNILKTAFASRPLLEPSQPSDFFSESSGTFDVKLFNCSNEVVDKYTTEYLSALQQISELSISPFILSDMKEFFASNKPLYLFYQEILENLSQRQLQLSEHIDAIINHILWEDDVFKELNDKTPATLGRVTPTLRRSFSSSQGISDEASPISGGRASFSKEIESPMFSSFSRTTTPIKSASRPGFFSLSGHEKVPDNEEEIYCPMAQWPSHQ